MKIFKISAIKNLNLWQVFKSLKISTPCNLAVIQATAGFFDLFLWYFTWAGVEPGLLGLNSSFLPLDHKCLAQNIYLQKGITKLFRMCEETLDLLKEL